MSNKKFFSGLFLGLLISLSLAICASSPTGKGSEYSYGKNDVVSLYGPVNEQSAVKVIARLKAIQDDSDKPIYFFIDSGGGEVFQGTKIIDAMLASKRPIYTVDIGMAASMAAFIHSYGQKRFMLPHAVLMFHNASGGYEGDLEKVKSRVGFVNLTMLSLEQNVAKRSGIPIEELKARENAEWWVLSGEALQRKLVDNVVVTLDFPVNVPEKEKEDS